MTAFVLVHGGWGGGWEWFGVAPILRSAGHQVWTPTLTGLGERAHASPTDITLETHIEDLAQYLWFEDITDAVLVGWSYGAAVVEGVADRMPERARLVVNFDGQPVREGRSGLDASALSPEELATGLWQPPTEKRLADAIDDEQLIRFVAERLRAQATATVLDPFPDRGGRRRQVPHAYLLCDNGPMPDEDLAELDALRADPNWTVNEIPTNHLGLLYAPNVVAAALVDLAQR
jgi:pimeloyl-ACP methyl ester carboxylesterase